MKINNVTRTFKRIIISSSLFWKIRHFFQPSWIGVYEKKKTPEFYFDLISKNNFTSILDFGCASGSLLYDINKKNPKTFSYGIDINKEAIKACNRNFKALKTSNISYFFDNKLNQKNLQAFLLKNNLTAFDLIIFDRVLYCLNEKHLHTLLEPLSKVSSFILIDDFMISNKLDALGYKHRDWIGILQKFNFQISINISTIHSNVDNANARTMLFKKVG